MFTAANFVMINHRACEQLIPFNNNLKIMSLEQATKLLQNPYTHFNLVANIANSFWRGAMKYVHSRLQMINCRLRWNRNSCLPPV